MGATVAAALDDVMATLADRIAENREVAGVHYESDTIAGRNLAVALFDVLNGKEEQKGVSSFIKIRDQAKKEWSDLVSPEPRASIPSEPLVVADVAPDVVDKIVDGVASKLHGPKP